MGCCKSKQTGEEITRKVAVVGNAGVGKTCLIQRYIHDEFEEDTPSVNIPSALQVDEKVEVLKRNKQVHLFIYDLGGPETFKHLRRLNYPKSDAAIICIGIDDAKEIDKSVKTWAEDFRKICPGIPILLVGLKKDKRDEARSVEGFVRSTHGHTLAKKNNLVGYLECSALKPEGINEVFIKIATEAVKRDVPKRDDDDTGL